MHYHPLFLGQSRPQQLLDLDLLRERQGIVFVYPKIPNSALEAGVTQKKLNSPYVLSFSVDDRSLGPSESMCTV